MQREEKGLLLAWVVVVGMMVSVVFHYYQAMLHHLGWPQNTFLYITNDIWNDFFNIFRSVQSPGGPFSSTLTIYFPFMYALLYPLAGLKSNIAFIFYVMAFLATAVVFVKRYLYGLPSLYQRLITTILVMMSYPMLFCIDRGNLEMLVFIFLALFVLFYTSGRIQASILFLAGAGAMKGYPLVYGALLIIDRRYKEVFKVALFVVVATVLPAALYPGGFMASLRGMLRNLSMFHNQISQGAAGLAYSASYFSVIMHAGHSLLKWPFPLTYQRISVVYLIGCLALFAAMLWYLVKYETIFWKKLTLLTFAMLLLPQVSYDYKLVHLLIPIMAFIGEDRPERNDWLYVWLFGLLLIPKAYYFIFQDAHIGVIINPLLMTLIGVWIISDRFVNRQPQT